MSVNYSRRLSCLIIVLALVALLAPESSYSQPASYYEGTGHWYQYLQFSPSLCWTASRDTALARGGYLATVLSTEENQMIAGLTGPQTVWLGGSEPNNDGQWAWVTGEPWSFTSWAAGEPSNSGGIENYLALGGISGPSGWNDAADCNPPVGLVVEYNTKPTWANWCDDFDDGTGWLNRWQTLEGSQNLVSGPVHSGAQSLEFHGSCGSTIIKKNWVAKEGYYTVYVNQRHHQAGFSMAIQVQPGAGVNPFFRDCYNIRLHAADAQPPGTFVFERLIASGGPGTILASGTPTFLKDEWIQVFIRRLPGNTFIAGYERPNGFRDSLICSDPNPPISEPGSVMLWACSDVPPYTYFDDFCYNSMSIGSPDTLRIGQGTECLTSVSPSQLIETIYLDNIDTVKAGDIPFCYDWTFDPDSISFVGTRLAAMDFKSAGIDAGANSARILFVADFGGSGTVLPPVDAFTRNTPIAKVYFHLPYACNETWVQAPDTCSVVLVSDVISLELVDKYDQPYKPFVVQNSTRVLQYRIGDCDGNQIITISDAVCIISYIFSGGQPSCIEASDADCNGIVTISDVVYLINYIFAGGPVPGANCLCGPAPMIAKATVGVANVGTTISAMDNLNLIEVNLQSSAAVRAVQLDFTVSGDVHNVQVASGVDQLQLFSGVAGDEYRVGLIDLTGTATIAAGSGKVAVVSYEGTGELSIASATVVDNDAAEMTVTIGNTKRESSLPIHYELAQNQPNPFNPSTDISFSLPKSDRVMLVVYNILGEEIAVLVDDAKAAGVHRVTWDGRDKSGRAVASGVYFYKLIASDFSQSRKMLMLK